MWAPETGGVKQPLLSDEGSRNTYAGQALRKYLLGTQGRPDLCFSGLSIYGEPNCALSSIQPMLRNSGQSSLRFCVVLHCVVFPCKTHYYYYYWHTTLFLFVTDFKDSMPISSICGIWSAYLWNPNYVSHVFKVTVAVDMLGNIVWICPLAPRRSAHG